MVRHTAQQAALQTVIATMGALIDDEVDCEAWWVDAPMIAQPTRCFRCSGLIVNDQEARRLWRCVNCGCRGEGWAVYGTTVGYAQRVERAPQISGSQTAGYQTGDYSDEDAY